MESVIKELWYGNINPLESGLLRGREFHELQNCMVDCCNKIEKSLTDEQKKVFEKLMDTESDYACLAETAVFSYGFRLGAKMIMDIIYGENSSK